MQLRVSGVAGLGHGEALEFRFEREGERRRGFVLRHGEDYFAYHNRCPHWGVDLDMGEGRFYSALTDRIYCSSHGALFVVDSGYCDAGPCVGAGLEQFEITVQGDEATITIADVDPEPRW